MKFFIILTLILLSLCAQTYAENPIGLAFDKKNHDFGKVAQNSRVTAIFHYTNKTDKMLKIKKVHTSCGCTVARTTKKVLNPNDYGEITITFNTGGSRGSTRKYITFETEPPIRPHPRLFIIANIVPDIYVEPVRIINIKLPGDNTPISKSVKILSEYTNFKIENIAYDTNSIRVKKNKYISTNQNVFGYILNITLFPEPIKKKTKGLHFIEIIKIETSLNKHKFLDLNIQGQIQ